MKKGRNFRIPSLILHTVSDRVLTCFESGQNQNASGYWFGSLDAVTIIFSRVSVATRSTSRPARFRCGVAATTRTSLSPRSFAHRAAPLAIPRVDFSTVYLTSTPLQSGRRIEYIPVRSIPARSVTRFQQCAGWNAEFSESRKQTRQCPLFLISRSTSAIRVVKSRSPAG